MWSGKSFHRLFSIELKCSLFGFDIVLLYRVKFFSPLRHSHTEPFCISHNPSGSNRIVQNRGGKLQQRNQWSPPFSHIYPSRGFILFDSSDRTTQPCNEITEAAALVNHSIGNCSDTQPSWDLSDVFPHFRGIYRPVTTEYTHKHVHTQRYIYIIYQGTVYPFKVKVRVTGRAWI